MIAGNLLNLDFVTNYAVAAPDPEALTAPAGSDAVVLMELLIPEQKASTIEFNPPRATGTMAERRNNYYGYGTANAKAPHYRGNATTHRPQEAVLLASAYGALDLPADIGSAAFTGFTPGAATVYTGVADNDYRVGMRLSAGGTTQRVLAVDPGAQTVTTDRDSQGQASVAGTLAPAFARARHTLKRPRFHLYTHTDDYKLTILQGCAVANCNRDVSKENWAVWDMALEYQRRYELEPCALAAPLANGATSCTVDPGALTAGQRYLKGLKVYVDGTPGLAAATIDKVEGAVVTFTAAAVVTGGPIQPGATLAYWLPAPAYVGGPITLGSSVVHMADAPAPATDAEGGLWHADALLIADSATLNIARELAKPLEKAMTGNPYPESRIKERGREVALEAEVVVYDDQTGLFEHVRTQQYFTLGLRQGEEPGDPAIEDVIERAHVEDLSLVDREGTQGASVKGRALEGPSGPEGEHVTYFFGI